LARWKLVWLGGERLEANAGPAQQQKPFQNEDRQARPLGQVWLRQWANSFIAPVEAGDR
jgi:hypothetical protein